MKKALIILMTIALLAGCSQTPEQQADRLFAQGVKHLENFEYTKAADKFDKVAELFPGSPRGLLGHAMILEKQLMYFDALHLYLTISEAEETFSEAFDGIRRITTHFGMYEEALGAAVECLKVAADYEQAAIDLARSFINVEVPGRARQTIGETEFSTGLVGIAHLVTATALFQENKFDSMQIELLQASETSTETPAFNIAMADYLEHIGHIDSSIVQSRRAVDLSDNQFDEIISHFFRCLRNNYFFEARQIISQLQQAGANEVMKHAMELLYYEASGNLIEARFASTELLRTGGEKISALYYEIPVRGMLREGIVVDQNIKLIEGQMVKRGYNEKFQTLMKYYLGITFAQFDEPRIAIEKLNSLPPTFLTRKQVKLGRIDNLYDSGQRETANRELETLLPFHQTQPDWLTAIADVCADSGARMYDRAEEIYTQALKVNEWYLPAFENQVEMYRRLKRYDDALTIFTRYPYFEEQYPKMAVIKAKSIVQSGQIDQGLELFKDAIPYLKSDLTHYNELIDFLILEGHTEYLDGIISIMLDLNPDNIDALFKIANVRFVQEDIDGAADLIDQILESEPGYLPASALKAHTLYKHGQRREAIEILEEILTQDPNMMEASYILSRILATDSLDFNRASNLARSAVFRSHRAFDKWMNLCFVYYQMGRFDLARGEALKASRKYFYRPEPFYWIGMAMAMEGNEEAKGNLEKSIQLGLSGDDLEKARQTLNEL